jgi:phytoene dehydrogenase-like protein
MYSCKAFLDEYFESEEVKAVLSTQGFIGTMSGPTTPGTAYVLGHHLLGQIGEVKEAWGWAKGGIGSISTALASAATAHGAVLRTGAPVKAILARGGKVTGVELGDGTRLASRAVLSTVDPKVTFLKLLDPSLLPEEFIRAVRNYRTRGAAAKVNMVVKELPDFTSMPGRTVGPQHTGTIDVVGPNLDYIEAAYDEAKYGEPSSHPWFELAIQSSVDPTVASKGWHVYSIFAQFAPDRLRKGSWEGRREEFGDRVVETLGEYAPNVPGAVVHRQVLSPMDIEAMVGMTGGNIFQGDMTPDQILSFRPVPGWSGYRMPLEGLYLGGAATHPGGGILSAPGHNAAQVILEDLKGVRGR